jgi:hypothetical protein
MATDERWVFGNTLNVEKPEAGSFSRSTLYSKLTLGQPDTLGKDNWLLASVPAPNVTEGWSIADVMLRYTIRGEIGAIDKVGLRDGNELVHSFEDPSLAVPIPDWETLTLTLPSPRRFTFGLGVSIHASYEGFGGSTAPPPTEFLFASVGLKFVR